MSLNEAYADELMDGVDLNAHGASGPSYGSGMSMNFYGWLIVVGAMALLWLLGGVVFRGAVH